MSEMGSTAAVPAGFDRDAAAQMSTLELVRGPRALRILAVLLAGLLVLLAVALGFVPWQQNVLASGRVVAFAPTERQQTIAAPVMGRVKEVWVVEGSEVKKGDRLLEITDNDPAILERLEQQRQAVLAKLEATRAKAASYEDQVVSLEAARALAVTSAENQVRVADAKVLSEQHALEGARAGLAQARLNFERQAELHREGLASKLEREVSERQFREAEAKVAQATQYLEAARSEAAAKRADLGKVDTEAKAKVESAVGQRQAARGEVANEEKELAAFTVRITQQSTQLITAPRDGTIFRVLAAPGAELVKAGDALAILIPDTATRAVELWIDGNDLPLMRAERHVRLQFEGWPAVQFAGWPSVAVGTFGGVVRLVDPTDDGKGKFRLLVLPDPNDPPWPEARYLRQGVRANGFVLLDTVSLGYEIWRQMNGFPPTVAIEGSKGGPKPVKVGK